MLWFRLRWWWKKHWLGSLLLALVFVAGFNLMYFGSQALTGWAARDSLPLQKTTVFLGDPYDLSDYTRVQVEVFTGGVLFKHDCQGFWIAMPYEKTFSIKRGSVGVLDIRPTQHDLMHDIFAAYTINMTYARIERVEHDFYYATVLLENEEKILRLDTRPSDALALASRFGAPLYISTKLLRQQGRNLCNNATP